MGAYGIPQAEFGILSQGYPSLPEFSKDLLNLESLNVLFPAMKEREEEARMVLIELETPAWLTFFFIHLVNMYNRILYGYRKNELTFG